MTVIAPEQASLHPSAENGSMPHQRSFWSVIRAYVSLTKPKVILLLEVPTLAAMLVAGAPAWPSVWLVVITLLSGALAAGGSAAINCWFDRDIDAEMGSRTKRRPIPSGEVSAQAALTFGVVLAVGSILVLLAFVNALSALLTGVAVAIYVGVYTLWLKRSTPSNIVLGGAAGAIPPLIGWAAVTGDLSATPWLLFALIFFWTPPHFWALALLIHEQYARAGVPMLPVVRGEAETRRQIVMYSVQMVAVSALLFGLGGAGLTYLIGAGALGGYFIMLALRLARDSRREDASRLFHYSMIYLVLLCATLVLDARVDFWAS
jgi:protoheme IX farnesyltransferase